MGRGQRSERRVVRNFKSLVVILFIGIFIAACVSSNSKRNDFVIADSKSYEASLFRQNCALCHGTEANGKESNGAWKSAIDVAGVLLTFVALTGLGLLFYLKKVRVAALLSMATGAILVWSLIKLPT